MYTVYRLENIVTKKNYIGMTSQEPKERWCGAYHGKMKEAIATYPLDLCWKKSIEFQTPNKEQALELESELMKWYDSVDNGYNTSAYATHSCKHSEETRKKMAEAHTGKHHSEETKKKMSKAQTGKHFTEEHKNKLSEAHTGKHPSEEMKNKIRENTPSKPIIQFSKDGEFIAEYSSLMEAEHQTGCYHGNICKCCKGKLKSIGGYIWRYK